MFYVPVAWFKSEKYKCSAVYTVTSEIFVHLSLVTIIVLICKSYSWNKRFNRSDSIGILYGARDLVGLIRRARYSVDIIHGARDSVDFIHGARHSVDFIHGARYSIDFIHGARESVDFISEARYSVGLIHGARYSVGLIHGVKRFSRFHSWSKRCEMMWLVTQVDVFCPLVYLLL